jgi:chemotaxis protein MotB
MAGQKNAAPVVIKRKKIIQGGGHHGGAWKVAYADFVTAMMAFFMLMWLLNATTEKQRKGLADYFNPTIPVNRISGGGDGALGGDSVTTEDTRAQSGRGASSLHPTEERRASGARDAEATGKTPEAAEGGMEETSDLAEIERKLAARSGESMTMEQALRHVTTRVTDEGLVIEVFDLEERTLFDGDTATPQPVLRDIAALLSDVVTITTNPIAVNGHVRSFPITLIDHPGWTLSAQRAQTLRDLLEGAGLPAGRVQRISGFSDRKPVTANPMAARNNRLEVILLRTDR